ncbi:TasA family protein [Tessaracoccus antarcticus]|nr:TasA family protein [Tessaracoccus antarcticus]
MDRIKMKNTLRIGAVALIGLSALSIGANGVYATLNAKATNVTPQVADSGTLSLTMIPGTGSAGFGTKIDNLAPGDVSNRYVDLTNGGTLASTGLSLDVVATGTPSLITDGSTSKALRVTVKSCPVAWDLTNGTCTGTTKTEIAAAPLSSLSAARAFTTTTGLTVGAISRLQVSISLPDQSETTLNGVAPVGTVQGGSVSLTYSFTEAQASPATTNR